MVNDKVIIDKYEKALENFADLLIDAIMEIPENQDKKLIEIKDQIKKQLIGKVKQAHRL